MDGINTANNLIILLTGLIGLVGTITGMLFAIKAGCQNFKAKNKDQIGKVIICMADAAMREVEKSALKGSEKKQMVIDSVKAGCKASSLEIDCFIDQLSAYIDDTITFVNGMTKKGC